MINFILKNHTNLTSTATLQEGTRVTYLNNKYFEHNICNGTIGIITKIIDNNIVEVTFPTAEEIIKINVQKSHYTLTSMVFLLQEVNSQSKMHSHLLFTKLKV